MSRVTVTVYPADNTAEPLVREPVAEPIMLPGGWVHLDLGDGRSELYPPTVARITVTVEVEIQCDAFRVGPGGMEFGCTRMRHDDGAHDWAIR